MRRSSANGKATRDVVSPKIAQNRCCGLAPCVWVTFERSSVDHGRTSPVALPLFLALDDAHAGSGGGLGLSRSIRRRISANKTRGTATSANWNTT